MSDTPRTWIWPDGRTTSNFHLLTPEERAAAGYVEGRHEVEPPAAPEASVASTDCWPAWQSVVLVLALVLSVASLVLNALH